MLADFFRMCLTLVVAVGCEFTCAQDPLVTSPEIVIEVKLDRQPDRAFWDVQWQASGLEKNKQYQLTLEDWGEWAVADSLFLRNLRSNISLEKLERGTQNYTLRPPEDWDGTIEISYRILMMAYESKARETFGLMPWYQASFGQGFTSNTLMEIHEVDQPLTAKRIVRFIAEANETIVSGWGLANLGRLTVESNRPLENTVVYFGQPTIASKANADNVVQVVQFGSGDIANQLSPKINQLFQVLSSAFGYRPAHPPTVILADTGGGGVNVAGAMVVGYSSSDPDEFQILLTSAHELFHEWLGGSDFLRVRNPESVWFQEGFTDYLSLWYLAKAKLITPQQFVDRILDLRKSLIGNAAIGEIAFNDDVEWRDGDGPKEMMAYRGGALLAFCADVELRQRGHEGLSRMIKELSKIDSEVDNRTIAKWFKSNGMGDFFDSFINAPQFVDVNQALIEIGCRKSKVPIKVAYAGLKNDQDNPFGKIVAMDPEGVAKVAGVRIGDQILGFWPASERQITFDSGQRPQYDYGLNYFLPNDEINFGVRRGDEELTIQFTPKVRDDLASELGFVVEDGTLGVFFDQGSK